MQIGDAARVQAAQAKRDAALSQARREGFDEGKRRGVQEASEGYTQRLEGVTQAHGEELTRLQARGEERYAEGRRSGYWYAAAKWGIGGVLSGTLLTAWIGAIVLTQQERSLQAGATTALEATERDRMLQMLAPAVGAD
jgi:hypothetical protein